MENYDKQITSEVTHSPKNKKKIVLISVIAAVVVLLILLSGLIPALILNAKIESLMEAKQTSDLDYFEFYANDDRSGYYAIVKTKVIIPKDLIIPHNYDNYPVLSVTCNSINDIETITLTEGLKEFSITNCENLTKIILPKSVSEVKRNKQFDFHTSSFYYVYPILDCPKLSQINYFSTTSIEQELINFYSMVDFNIID